MNFKYNLHIFIISDENESDGEILSIVGIFIPFAQINDNEFNPSADFEDDAVDRIIHDQIYLEGHVLSRLGFLNHIISDYYLSSLLSPACVRMKIKRRLIFSDILMKQQNALTPCGPKGSADLLN